MTVSVFQPTTLDVEISSAGGGNGTSPTISVANNMKALFFFDVSSIPSTDTCSSAVFRVWNSINGYADTITAYAIKSGNSGWNESATDTTINGTTAWAGSNWCNTPGTDYESVAIGSATNAVGHFNPTDFNFDANVVRTWFGATNSNYGFFLITSSTNSNIYYSRQETTNTSLRPRLTITHAESVFSNRRSFAPLGTRVGSRSDR